MVLHVCVVNRLNIFSIFFGQQKTIYNNPIVSVVKIEDLKFYENNTYIDVYKRQHLLCVCVCVAICFKKDFVAGTSSFHNVTKAHFC